MKPEVAFISCFLSFTHKNTHWVGLLACFTNYWWWINKYPPSIHYTMWSLFCLVFIIQVQGTVMIMTAVVVSWEKKRAASFIHNTTSCGCTAFWSIFWYCQWRDCYLVLFYDRFLPVWLLMQNGESLILMCWQWILTRTIRILDCRTFISCPTKL